MLEDFADVQGERRGDRKADQAAERPTDRLLSETERKKGRFCFLLKSSSVKPELPFSKPTCVQDLREATMKLSCSLSKALSGFHSPTSTYSQVLPLSLLLSKTVLGEYLHTPEWDNLHSKVRWKLQLCKRNGVTGTQLWNKEGAVSADRVTLQSNEWSELIIYKQALLTQFHKLGHGSVAASFSTSSHWEVVNVPWRQAQHCSHHIACYLSNGETPA